MNILKKSFLASLLIAVLFHVVLLWNWQAAKTPRHAETGTKEMLTTQSETAEKKLPKEKEISSKQRSKSDKEEIPKVKNIDSTPEEQDVAFVPKAQTKADIWQEKVNQLSNSKRTILRSAISKGDYKYFLSRLKLGQVKTTDTPKLTFAWRDNDELVSVHKYFRMKILAENPLNKKDTLQIDLGAFGDLSYQRVSDFDYSIYSSKRLKRSEKYFEPLRQKLRQEGLYNDKVLVSLIPLAMDRYFCYKVQQAAKLNNHRIDEVKRSLGSFYKTSFGLWILKIEYLELNSGKIVPVQDFEYNKIIGR